MATADIKEADDELDEHTKPPFLRRVRIRGYKSIAFCDVTLEPLTILVGRNGSGKSNFLDALAFLRDVVGFSLGDAIKRHGGWSSVVCRLGRAPSVEMEFDVQYPGLNATYSLQISGGENVRPTIHEGLDYYHRPGQPKSEPFPNEGDFDRSALRFKAPPCPKIADGFQRMSLHNIDPNAVRRLQKPSNGNPLEKDAGNLASVVRTLKDVDPASLNRVKQYACHIVEEVSDFWVQAYGEYETVRFRMRTTAGDKPLEFDAESMSDGTLRVLSNIVAAFQNVPPYGHPSVVGIEEPETALHPRAMNALVDALDEATLRTQVLLTTHSTELLDNPTIQPKNVRVVEMVDGQTVIAPVDAANVEVVQRNLNTLGGLERDNRLEGDLDDRERQELLQKNGQEPHQ